MGWPLSWVALRITEATETVKVWLLGLSAIRLQIKAILTVTLRVDPAKVGSVAYRNSSQSRDIRDENLRRTEIIRASSGASGRLMEMMQNCFHDRARTEPRRRGQVASRSIDGTFPNRIGKISRFNQRYFIATRLEVEEIKGRLDCIVCFLCLAAYSRRHAGFGMMEALYCRRMTSTVGGWSLCRCSLLQ